MKQLFLTLILFLGTVVATHAQTQVATLSQGDSIFTFYGIDALKDAYNQSVDGDVITLSAGSFRSVDFAKAIAVRGAGMGILVDSMSTFTEPTILLGSFTVNAGTQNQPFTLEGVVNDAQMTMQGTNGAQFSKCKFSKIIFYPTNGVASDTIQNKNCNFLHCYVTSDIDGTNAEINAISCYFVGYRSAGSSNGGWNMNNCVIDINFVTGNTFANSSFKNCIFYYHGYQGNTSQELYKFDTNSVYAIHCLCFGKNNIFDNYPSEYANSYLSSLPFVDNTFCKLTDEAKQYLGDDGTEVGIYGGSIPFDPTPNYPQIKNFKVAGQTSETGTLHVEMEITQP